MKIARKVINMPTPNSIDAHVGLLHLLGSIVKRGGGVLHGCYCHYHIGSEDSTVWAFKALRLYLKYLAHKHSVFKFIIYNCSCFSAETVNHLLSRGKDYANERNENLFSNCRVQLIFWKDYANKRNERLLSNCRVQLIFCKDYANERNESCFQIAECSKSFTFKGQS